MNAHGVSMTAELNMDAIKPGRWLCPVRGIECKEELDYELLRIDSDNDDQFTFRIRTLEASEKQKLGNATQNLPLTSLDIFQLSVAVEAFTPVVFGLEPVRTMGLSAITYALALGYSGISIPHCILMSPEEAGVGPGGGVTLTGHDLYLAGLPPQVSVIDPATLPTFRNLAYAILNSWEQLEMPLSRFYHASNRANYLDQLLDYVIAVECVVKANDASKFERRVAALLNYVKPDDHVPEVPYRKLYEVRSKLVHGNRQRLAHLLDRHFGGNPIAAARQARALASAVLQGVLRKKELLDSKFIDKLARLGAEDKRT
jgi:hypothetical protein